LDSLENVVGLKFGDSPLTMPEYCGTMVLL